MADAPIVEESDGTLRTSEKCLACRKVTSWRKEGDAPWYCTRCGQKELQEDTPPVHLDAPSIPRGIIGLAQSIHASVGFCGRCGANGYFGKNPCENCGAHVWGPWLPVDYRHLDEIPVLCPYCNHVDPVPAEAEMRTCTACNSALYFCQCKNCDRLSQRLVERPDQFRCAYCRSKAWTLPMPAGAYFVDAITSAAWVPTIDPDMRWVNDCVVLAAAGVSFAAGATCVLRFDANGLSIVQPAQKRATYWPYSEIHALELGGPGMVQTQTGGGFIGGGFGIAGAAEGMLAAAALNALTKRKNTSITTLIVLKTTTSEIVFLNQQLTPEKLQLDLTPAFLRLRMAHAATAQAPALPAPDIPSDPVARLRELAALVKEGILTEAEFQDAKKKILENIK